MNISAAISVRRASRTSGSRTASRIFPLIARRRAPSSSGRWTKSSPQPSSDPRVPPRRGREQAVRHRLRVLRCRFARVLSRLRHREPQTPVPRRWALSPDGKHRRQNLIGADLPRRDPAARQRHGKQGQRSCGDPVDDDLRAIAEEIVRQAIILSRIHIGLDFFDASINRVAAWVIGTRCSRLRHADRVLRTDPRRCAWPGNRAAITRDDWRLLEELKALALRGGVGLLLSSARRASGTGVVGRGPGIRARVLAQTRIKVTAR